MKIIVSTTQTQGQRENDFCFVPEGEPVYMGIPCDKDKDNPDGACGCSRSVCGFTSQTATTTMKVAETEMTKEEYMDAYVQAWRKAGWKVSARMETELNKEAAKLLEAAGTRQ